jgi:hypothetical protein
MSLNNPWVMAGVAAAVYAAWYFGRDQGYRNGYVKAQRDFLLDKTSSPQAGLAYDPTALTATVSNAGTSGMTIASNPAISSVNMSTNGAAYNV